MNLIDIKDYLMHKGYIYFMIDNIESSSSGKTIFHYILFSKDESRSFQTFYPLNSDEGEHLINEFLSGEAKLHLLIDTEMHVLSNGLINENLNTKPFTL